MANFSLFKLTTVGQHLLAENIAGNGDLVFTKFELGDGVYSGAVEDATGLVNLFLTKDISGSFVQKDNSVALKCLFDNKGFTTAKDWKEIGIYARLGSDQATEVLYAYSFNAITVEQIPAENTQPYKRLLDIRVKISNATNVTINVVDETFKYDFNTVAEMKASTHLVDGDKITLWGYNSLNDGSKHYRVISSSDDGSGIDIGNGLFANYIYNEGRCYISHLGFTDTSDLSEIKTQSSFLTNMIKNTKMKELYLDIEGFSGYNILINRNNLIIDGLNKNFNYITETNDKYLNSAFFYVGYHHINNTQAPTVENIIFRNLNVKGAITSSSLFLEWAHCIFIGSSNKILIENCNFENIPGDGFMLYGDNTRGNCENIVINSCDFKGIGNSRNSISIDGVIKCSVNGCFFDNWSSPTMPGSIDIECDGASTNKEIIIENCIFLNNNSGWGAVSILKNAGVIDDVIILGCIFKNCSHAILSDTGEHIDIASNTFIESKLWIQSANVSFKNNTVTNENKKVLIFGESNLSLDVAINQKDLNVKGNIFNITNEEYNIIFQNYENYFITDNVFNISEKVAGSNAISRITYKPKNVGTETFRSIAVVNNHISNRSLVSKIFQDINEDVFDSDYRENSRWIGNSKVSIYTPGSEMKYRETDVYSNNFSFNVDINILLPGMNISVAYERDTPGAPIGSGSGYLMYPLEAYKVYTTSKDFYAIMFYKTSKGFYTREYDRTTNSWKPNWVFNGSIVNAST